MGYRDRYRLSCHTKDIFVVVERATLYGIACYKVGGLVEPNRLPRSTYIKDTPHRHAMAFQLRALGSLALSPEIGLALSSPGMLAPRMLAQDARPGCRPCGLRRRKALIYTVKRTCYEVRGNSCDLALCYVLVLRIPGSSRNVSSHLWGP
jgi:hypothetical protein